MKTADDYEQVGDRFRLKRNHSSSHPINSNNTSLYYPLYTDIASERDKNVTQNVTLSKEIEDFVTEDVA